MPTRVTPTTLDQHQTRLPVSKYKIKVEHHPLHSHFQSIAHFSPMAMASNSLLLSSTAPSPTLPARRTLLLHSKSSSPRSPSRLPRKFHSLRPFPFFFHWKWWRFLLLVQVEGCSLELPKPTPMKVRFLVCSSSYSPASLLSVAIEPSIFVYCSCSWQLSNRKLPKKHRIKKVRASISFWESRELPKKPWALLFNIFIHIYICKNDM